MRFSYIMDGCAEELTDQEWKWLTLVLSPTETQNPRLRAHEGERSSAVKAQLYAFYNVLV